MGNKSTGRQSPARLFFSLNLEYLGKRIPRTVFIFFELKRFPFGMRIKYNRKIHSVQSPRTKLKSQLTIYNISFRKIEVRIIILKPVCFPLFSGHTTVLIFYFIDIVMSKNIRNSADTLGIYIFKNDNILYRFLFGHTFKSIYMIFSGRQHQPLLRYLFDNPAVIRKENIFRRSFIQIDSLEHDNISDLKIQLFRPYEIIIYPHKIGLITNISTHNRQRILHIRTAIRHIPFYHPFSGIPFLYLGNGYAALFPI